MTFLKKYKYTIIILIALTIGGVMLNANYYINKRPINPEKRVMQEQVEIGRFEHTRVTPSGQHTEENVLLGFNPDFDWSEETSYTLDGKKTITFENIPNFEYGSVVVDVGSADEGFSVTSEFQKAEGSEGKLFRLVYYGDVEVTEYVVDVYSAFGKYKYSFNQYSNVVVDNKVELSIISEEEAAKQGLN